MSLERLGPLRSSLRSSLVPKGEARFGSHAACHRPGGAGAGGASCGSAAACPLRFSRTCSLLCPLPAAYFFLYSAGSVFLLPFINIAYRDLGFSEEKIGVLLALKPWVSAVAGKPHPQPPARVACGAGPPRT